MEVFFNPVQNETGNYALCNIVDVTERKTEQTKLEARASELTRSNMALEQFAYATSHDLQEPLRKLISCCQILAIDHSDKLSGDARRRMDSAIDGAKRLQSLISGLLDTQFLGRFPLSDRGIELDGDETDDAACPI